MVAAKAEVVEPVCIVEGAAAAWITCCTLDEIDMVCERNEVRPTVKHLDNDLVTVCKQVSDPTTM